MWKGHHVSVLQDYFLSLWFWDPSLTLKAIPRGKISTIPFPCSSDIWYPTSIQLSNHKGLKDFSDKFLGFTDFYKHSTAYRKCDFHTISPQSTRYHQKWLNNFFKAFWSFHTHKPPNWVPLMLISYAVCTTILLTLKLQFCICWGDCHIQESKQWIEI